LKQSPKTDIDEKIVSIIDHPAVKKVWAMARETSASAGEMDNTMRTNINDSQLQEMGNLGSWADGKIQF